MKEKETGQKEKNDKQSRSHWPALAFTATPTFRLSLIIYKKKTLTYPVEIEEENKNDMNIP